MDMEVFFSIYSFYHRNLEMEGISEGILIFLLVSENS